MNKSLKDLLASSHHNSDQNEREIIFADAGKNFKNLDRDDWKQLKHNL